jgi:hypothetical protein
MDPYRIARKAAEYKPIGRPKRKWEDDFWRFLYDRNRSHGLPWCWWWYSGLQHYKFMLLSTNTLDEHSWLHGVTSKKSTIQTFEDILSSHQAHTFQVN